MTIPKINHQLWISQDGQAIPKDIIKNIKSWQQSHPSFDHILWGLEDLKEELGNFYNLNVWQYVKQCRFPAMQSDLIRLALVYKHGGFWNDLKNYSMKPFMQDYINVNLPVFAQHFPTELPNRAVPHIANGFMASPPQDSLVWECLVSACNNIENRADMGVFGLTGGGLISTVIRSNKDNQNRYILIPHEQVWNSNIKRSGGSYNDNGKHWSVRQKVESPFLD